MGFNIGSGLMAGIQGFLETGNPAAGVAMGVAGGLAGGGATAGNLQGDVGNAQLGWLDQQNEQFQVQMYAEQMRHQEQLQTAVASLR